MNTEFIVPTGKIIKEYLDEYGISQKDFSERIGLSEKHVSNLLNGKTRLTEDVALRMEFLIKDVPASYWINYEAKYRENVERERFKARYDDAHLKEYAKRFFFKEVFKGLGWSLDKQADEMLKILGISDFSCFDQAYESLSTAFMEDGGEKEAIVIWLRLCDEQISIQNRDISNVPYKKSDLKKNISLFKDIAMNPKFDGLDISCRKLCNELGINLVINPTIKNSKVRGALKRFKDHPTIYLSGRFNTHDHIWFAFFHELGHLMKHYDGSNYMEISYEDDNEDAMEKEANEFASDVLINPDDYKRFLNESFKNGELSKKAIRDFAKKQGVHPGIVVARLQHDKHIPFSNSMYNSMKVKMG